MVAAAYERFKYDVLDVGGLKEVVALTRGDLRDTFNTDSLKTQTLLDFEKVLRHLMWRGTL